MSIGSILAAIFEKIPEIPIKNDIRYFLAFSPLVPKFVSDISPVKGYELHLKLEQGDYVVDAGAYPGDYSILASRKVGQTGKVIAFEPDPKNREILRKNLEKEGRDNFIIVPKGLWNKNTKLNLENPDGLHSNLKGISGQQIEVVKLDDELKKLGIDKINVLKMDIEGSEVEALEGAEETLKNNKTKIIVASYHKREGKTTSYFVEDFLKKLGYETKSDFPKHLTTYGWKKV